MVAKRVNVLVYSGDGSTVDSVRHCLYTLRRLLSPNYAVIPVTGDMLIKEPWTATCAALVFPGGADQGYCRTLNGDGNRRIRQFVERGGVYIGFCAGGYYGCRRCEFEIGNKLLEVVGDRELAFFPGPCRGCAFPGFVYDSEKGARAATLQVDKTALSTGSVPNIFKAYYNGGGVFVDALKFRDQGVEVLASYTEEIAVDGGEGSAAVVYCKVGQGAALLTGPHPEFVFYGTPADNWSLTKPRYAAAALEKGKASTPGFAQVVDSLAGDENHRIGFLKACLVKLGLTVNEDNHDVPSLSLIHVSALESATCTKLLEALQRDGLIFIENGEQYLEDDNDKFHFVKPSPWIMDNLQDALPSTTSPNASQGTTATNISTNTETASSITADTTTNSVIIDYNTLTKQMLIHTTSPAHPNNKETPYFDHSAFFSHLTSSGTNDDAAFSCRTSHLDSPPKFGNPFIYGEVVTSTNSLLEKNTHLLRRLSTGTTFAATTQLAGRGRGSNIWVSPPGSLMFSTVIRHPMALMSRAPIVFVQYLAAMAVVQGVQTYDSADETSRTGSTTPSRKKSPYADVPIKLKWPNDIYALSPGRSDTSNPDAYTKIGGILVNSHYNAESYIAVCGVGLNVSNSVPTTSLNALLASSASLRSKPSTPAPFTPERLLARILICFEALYTRFLDTGFDSYFEDLYYKDWLHMDQVVTLETQGGARARIKGVTRDYGLLVAEELGWEDRTTGRRWELQSDSNSFDFFKGLVRRKA